MVCRAKRTRLYEGQSSERVSGLLWRSRNEGGGCYLTTLLTRVTWLGMRLKWHALRPREPQNGGFPNLTSQVIEGS